MLVYLMKAYLHQTLRVSAIKLYVQFIFTRQKCCQCGYMKGFSIFDEASQHFQSHPCSSKSLQQHGMIISNFLVKKKHCSLREKGRTLFRTLSDVKDFVFCGNIINGFQPFTLFAKHPSQMLNKLLNMPLACPNPLYSHSGCCLNPSSLASLLWTA